MSQAFFCFREEWGCIGNRKDITGGVEKNAFCTNLFPGRSLLSDFWRAILRGVEKGIE